MSKKGQPRLIRRWVENGKRSISNSQFFKSFYLPSLKLDMKMLLKGGKAWQHYWITRSSHDSHFFWGQPIYLELRRIGGTLTLDPRVAHQNDTPVGEAVVAWKAPLATPWWLHYWVSSSTSAPTPLHCLHQLPPSGREPRPTTPHPSQDLLQLLI